MSFKNNTSTSLRLCVCIVCRLFFTYALFEAVIEKGLSNRCLFKFAKSLKNTCESIYCYYIAAFRPLALLKLTISHTFSFAKLLPCVLGNV